MSSHDIVSCSSSTALAGCFGTDHLSLSQMWIWQGASVLRLNSGKYELRTVCFCQKEEGHR